MNSSLTPEILFLHGGPGMTAELERRRYEESLPVRWWDQPIIRSGAERPFEVLVDAACVQIRHLAEKRRGLIHILANSFGAYLTREVVERVPSLIGSITICSGVWDLPTAILRLGSRLAEQYCDADLEAACREAAHADSPEGYVALFARTSASPGFLDYCWSPAAIEQREAMKALAATGRLIDWPTCRWVLGAALSTPQVPLAAPHPGGVRILLGCFDPYFEESDVVAWKALWPSARVQIVEAGQFPHLELSPSVWLPAV